MYPISSNLPQQLLRVLPRRHREQMFPPGETVIAAGQGLERAILLDSQNVNVVFVSHIHIAHTASDPAVKRRNLVDGVFIRDQLPSPRRSWACTMVSPAALSQMARIIFQLISSAVSVCR